MLSPLEESTLAGFARGVRRALGPRVEGVVLFGSRARAEGREDSDLDVLVLVRGADLEARRAVQDLGWEATCASGLPVSPLVVDPESLAATPLAAEIARDGVAL